MSLNELPTELLIQILSEVPYWDLYFHVYQVNRHFYAILRGKSRGIGRLDRVLHRDIALPDDITNDIQFQTHPAFYILHYRCMDDLDRAELFYTPAIGYIPRNPSEQNESHRLVYAREQLIRSSIRDESAVCPAVSHLQLRLAEYHQDRLNISGTGIGGIVTVLDVVMGLGSLFSYPELRARSQRRGLPMDMTSVQLWYGNSYWMNFDKVEVEDGILQLWVYVW